MTASCVSVLYRARYSTVFDWWTVCSTMKKRQNFALLTGENLDAVTAVTDSFKMADVFAGDRTGGAVAQTSAQTICVSVWQGRMWVSWLQWMHGSSWLVVVNAKSAIVDPRDAAVTARGWCSISFVKPNNDTVTTKIPTQRQHHTL